MAMPDWARRSYEQLLGAPPSQVVKHHGRQLTSKDVNQLLTRLEVPDLTATIFLDLSWSSAAPGAVTRLFYELAAVTTLTGLRLHLPQQSLTPEWQEDLQGFLEAAAALQFVALPGLQLAPPRLKPLMRALRWCPTLHSLNLTGVPLGASEVVDEIGPKLAQLSSLTDLGLSDTQLDGSTAESLCFHLERCGQLRHLDLADNHLDAHASPFLANLVRCHPTLHALNLAGNKLDDHAAADFARALHPTSVSAQIEKASGGLAVLDLSRNPLTDRGVRALATAVAVSSCRLGRLDLQQTRLTLRGVAAFAQQLPRTNLHLCFLDLRSAYLRRASDYQESDAPAFFRALAELLSNNRRRLFAHRATLQEHCLTLLERTFPLLPSALEVAPRLTCLGCSHLLLRHVRHPTAPPEQPPPTHAAAWRTSFHQSVSSMGSWRTASEEAADREREPDD